MSALSLDDVRAEHRAVVIGPLVMGLLRVVVADVCGNYAPYVTTGAPSWDEAAREEILQSWAGARLVGPDGGALAASVAGAESLDALRRSLRQSLHWHFKDLHALGERARLAARVQKLLVAREDFHALGGRGNARRWTMSSHGPTRLDPVALARLAAQLDDDVLRVTRFACEGRAAPLLPTPQLGQVVEHVLSSAGGSVAFGDLVDALALRFGILGGGRETLSEIELPDPIDVEGEVEDQRRQRARSAVALQVAATLDADQRRTLLTWREDPSFARAGERLGVHPSTIRSRLDAILGALVECGIVADVLHGEVRQGGHTRLDGASWPELSELIALLTDILSQEGPEAVT